MERKYCVLFFSDYSPVSRDVLGYITNLSIDFQTIVGLTFVKIDNTPCKALLRKNGINYVPALFIKYYDNETQILYSEDIYQWIDEMMCLIFEDSTPEVDETVVEKFQDSRTAMATGKKPINPSMITAVNKKDVSSIALELQKSREKSLDKDKKPV